MAVTNISATLGASSDGQGQVAVEVKRQPNLNSAAADVATLAAVLASTQVGTLTTAQVGTLATASANLTAISAADVAVNYNTATVVSQSKLKTAVDAIVKQAADLTA